MDHSDVSPVRQVKWWRVGHEPAQGSPPSLSKVAKTATAAQTERLPGVVIGGTLLLWFWGVAARFRGWGGCRG